jgi:Druantia protein DruA/Transposase Tn5 dimerisation domain/Transposase DNA-binding
MLICGQTFSPGKLKDIQGLIDETPDISRRELSRRVCELLTWRHPNGRLKDMSCRKALSRLQRTGALRMPDAVQNLAFTRRSVQQEFVRSPVSCSLQELGNVTLVLVDNRLSEEAHTWNSLMNLHYLGARLFCAGLRYLVYSSVHGWLGALAFSPAAFRVSARDQFIGWSEQGRLDNLDRVIGNSRFFIHPEVRVPHLASHVLGKALRRLPRDWQSRYGKEPLLVETFVEQSRFTGTSYRAANWIDVGTTAGRGRQDSQHQAALPPKEMYVYPLHRRWRELLGGSIKEETPHSGDWADEEWGQASLGDARLVQRLISLGRDRYAHPQASIPQTCGSRSKTKAAYRFFDHERATLQNLLSPHIEAATKRLAKEKVVLAIQDTTSLNYGTHPATENLGPITNIPTGVVGLMLHSTLAVNSEGTPLGLLAAQCWARDPAEFGKKAKRHKLPIEEKESNKWLTSFKAATATAAACTDTTVVSVGDREADIYELFALAAQTPKAPLLLVRAQHDRKLQEEQGRLAKHMNECPEAGIQEIIVPRKGNRPARNAQISIRYSQVVLAPPIGKENRAPLSIWAILADEKGPPEGIEPLRWLLLTTAPTDNLTEACEHLSWYTKRWTIEVFHRTLKSGCRIENRQLGSANRLEACLAIDLVVAWRIHHLTKLGRETPDVPCSIYFEEAEWKALTAFVTKKSTPDDKPPTLREAIRMVAILGGFLARKSDGEPGTQTLWLGLQRLDDITEMWKVMTAILGHSPPSSHISGVQPKYG